MFGLKFVDLPARMNASKFRLSWVGVEAPSDGDIARHFVNGILSSAFSERSEA